MFTEKTKINELKQYPITAYLSAKGINPINAIGSQLLYYSPLSNENTASFFVNPSKNVFNDFSSADNGDVLRLIQLVEQVPFADAVKRLEGFKMTVPPVSFCFSGKNNVKQESKIEILSVKPLEHPSLRQYVQQRGICFEIAKTYLKEVHFQNIGKKYFAVGFENNGGGYELRNGLGYKGKTANGITVFDRSTKQINLFEGFFDFLSALQHFKALALKNTTVILNTNNNINLFSETFGKEHTINAFLDNDKSGQLAVKQLLNKGFEVLNQSVLMYSNSKDFNDYLLANGQ